MFFWHLTWVIDHMIFQVIILRTFTTNVSFSFTGFWKAICTYFHTVFFLILDVFLFFIWSGFNQFSQRTSTGIFCTRISGRMCLALIIMTIYYYLVFLWSPMNIDSTRTTNDRRQSVDCRIIRCCVQVFLPEKLYFHFILVGQPILLILFFLAPKHT